MCSHLLPEAEHGLEPRAMSGDDVIGRKGFYVLYCSLNPLGRSVDQMKASYDGVEVFDTGHLPGLSYGIDDARVGAAGKHHQPPSLYHEHARLFAGKMVLLLLSVPLHEKNGRRLLVWRHARDGAGQVSPGDHFDRLFGLHDLKTEPFDRLLIELSEVAGPFVGERTYLCAKASTPT